MATNQSSHRVTFPQLLCTLANITHVRDYSPTLARSSFPDQEKHLRLLDSIALLLVTEEKSDVAAVMFEQTTTEVIFYYSKNRPSTPEEQKYLEELRRLALSLTDVNECAMELLDHVIPVCRSKITSRIKRLKLCIPTPVDIADDPNGTFRTHLSNRMPHLFPQTGGLSCKQILLNFLYHVRHTDSAKCTEDAIGKLIRFAFAIGTYEYLQDLIDDDKVIRRIRKLGNYYSATKAIARTVDRFQRGVPSGTTLNISFREVRAAEQLTTYITNDHVGTLNRYASECGLDEITATALKAAYPAACTGELAKHPEQRVTHSVHAECTLAMHAIGMMKDWTHVELGVSKGSCWLCEKFLECMRGHHMHFLVSNFHGKLQPGWTCPASVGGMVRDSVEGIVRDAVREILEKVLNRRRSDSFPHDESDGEKKRNVRDGYKDDDLDWLKSAEEES